MFIKPHATARVIVGERIELVDSRNTQHVYMAIRQSNTWLFLSKYGFEFEPWTSIRLAEILHCEFTESVRWSIWDKNWNSDLIRVKIYFIKFISTRNAEIFISILILDSKAEHVRTLVGIQHWMSENVHEKGHLNSTQNMTMFLLGYRWFYLEVFEVQHFWAHFSSCMTLFPPSVQSMQTRFRFTNTGLHATEILSPQPNTTWLLLIYEQCNWHLNNIW